MGFERKIVVLWEDFMRVFDSKSGLGQIKKGLVLSIGNFDGVHLGHQEVIRTAKTAAQKRGAEGIAVMTFYPHPVAILHPEKAPGVLTPLPLKKVLLEKYGVDFLIVLKDSFDLLNLSPKAFVDEFMMEQVGPAVVVEGPNFNFGYGRSGNIETLRSLSADRGFEVIESAAKKINIEDRRSVSCSSTVVRNLLESGRVAAAASVMGRPYRLIGPAVAGRGVGRRLGFPTANIYPAEQIVPDEGVYAGFVEIGDSFEDVCVSNRQRHAAFSIGRAKTFVTDHPLMIEAHILDGDVEDLSGKYLAMDFVKKIRPQERFEGEEALKKQIAKDCRQAKEILADI